MRPKGVLGWGTTALVVAKDRLSGGNDRRRTKNYLSRGR